MKSCKSLETFLSLKNLTYYFAVETCLDEWWVTHWEKFLCWVNAFYQVWSWNRFDGLEEARWCDRMKRRDLSMPFSTVNNEWAVFDWWRPPPIKWELVQICWWWAVPLEWAVENQAWSWPCCSASLLTSGNAFYCECNVMCVTGNSSSFTIWTHGLAAQCACFHTCTHTCRQVLNQRQAFVFFSMAFVAYVNLGF